MDTKEWYKSKLVWLGVIQTLISSLFLLQEFLGKQDFSPVAIVGLIIGILLVIVRIWFTDKIINKGANG